jgi:sporulation protein YlmC with PRC-barrel domain
MDGYTVDRHEPDPRGWTVVNREGQRVGEVKDLVVDTERMTAPYLSVELDTRVFDLRDDDPRVLVPVERARADGRQLVMDDIGASWVSELRAARERHWHEFWDRWWHSAEATPNRGVRVRAIDEVRLGEEVRIPVLDEEIIVERRPVADRPRR